MEPELPSLRPVRLSPKYQQTPVDGVRDKYSALADDSSQSEDSKQAFMLVSVAEGHLSDTDAEEALKAASDALKTFRDKKDSVATADCLRIIINAHCVKGETKEAKRMADEELQAFRKAGDKRGEAAMQLSLADVCLTEEKLEDAFKAGTDASEAFGNIGDSKMEAIALVTLSRIKTAEELPLDAGRMAAAALLKFTKAGDWRGRAHGLQAQSRAYLSGGAIKEALRAADAAVVLFKKHGSRKEEGFEVLKMADMNMEDHKFQEATNLAKKAQGIFREISFPRGEHLALDTMVKVSLAKGHQTWALTIAKEGLERFQKAGEQRWEAATLGDTLLQVYIDKGNLDDALEAAEASLALCKNGLKDRKWEAKMLENVATVHILKRDWPQATSFGAEAVSCFEALGDLKNAGSVHYKLSGAHHQRGDHGAALEEAKEAREAFKKAGCMVSEVTALLGMCYAHQMMGDLDEAAKEAMDAATKADERRDKKGEAAAWLNLAAMNLVKAETSSALDDANKAEVLLRDHGSAHKLLADALHLKAQVYLSAGSPEEAARPAHEARVIYQRVRETAGEADALRLLAHIDQELLVKEVKEPNPDNNKHMRLIVRLQATAVKSAEEAVACFRSLGARFPLGVALHTLAQVRAAAQDGKAAVTAADEAVAIFKEVGDKNAEANALVVVADASMMAGDRTHATDAANAAAAIFRESGDAAGEAFAMGIFQDTSSMQMDTFAAAPAAAQSAVAKRPKLDPVVVRKTVMEKALELLTMDSDEADLSVDTPLMDAGLDSLAVIGFRDSLQNEFPGINLPAEMTFDYPSVYAVAGFIIQEVEALG